MCPGTNDCNVCASVWYENNICASLSSSDKNPKEKISTCAYKYGHGERLNSTDGLAAVKSYQIKTVYFVFETTEHRMAAHDVVWKLWNEPKRNGFEFNEFQFCTKRKEKFQPNKMEKVKTIQLILI